MELNNREIATLFWLTLLVVGAFAWPATRSSAFGVIKAFFRRPLLIVFAAAALYVAACVALLQTFHLWEWANLKTTMVWAASFAFLSMFDLNRIDEDHTYFRKTLRDTLSVTAALLFIAQFYAFRLAIELLLLPAITFIALLHAIPEAKPEHAAVNSLLGNLLATTGLTFFAYSAYQTVRHWSEFATVHTAREFGVPILLSILFLPFLYVMSVYSVYERVFIGLTWAIENDRLRRYAKRKALLNFRLDLDLLKRWRRMMLHGRPEECEAIRQSFRKVRILRERERNPPPVPPEEGWSPYLAKEFLAEDGVVSEDYHLLYEDEWMASSKAFKFGKRGFGNSITYYVEGNEHAARKLTLEVTVTHIEKAGEADERFVSMCRTLLRKALGNEVAELLPPTLADFETFVGGARVKLEKEEWALPKLKVYERALTIEHAAHPPDLTD
jgi:hypothetical protein